MKTRDAIRSIVLSWDLYAAFIVVVFIRVLLRRPVTAVIARDIFEVSITALSIFVSLFFAALAILITSGDSEFHRFLQEEGYHKRILWTFKVTLFLLFLSLLAAAVMYVLVLPDAACPQGTAVPYPGGWLSLFGWLSFYALFAAVNSCLDAIKYAELRERFLAASHPKQEAK